MTHTYLYDLPSVALDERHRLPAVAAVYFVFDDPDAMLYVGMSSNLRQRWRSHHRLAQARRQSGARIYWLAVDAAFGGAALAGLERYCIGKFTPVLNDAPMGWRMERAWLVGIIQRLITDRRRLIQERG